MSLRDTFWDEKYSRESYQLRREAPSYQRQADGLQCRHVGGLWWNQEKAMSSSRWCRGRIFIEYQKQVGVARLVPTHLQKEDVGYKIPYSAIGRRFLQVDERQFRKGRQVDPVSQTIDQSPMLEFMLARYMLFRCLIFFFLSLYGYVGLQQRKLLILSVVVGILLWFRF